MTNKFDKVMQNLRDSLDTSITIEDVEWCQVKKSELMALLGCAYFTQETSPNCFTIKSLEQCADE